MNAEERACMQRLKDYLTEVHDDETTHNHYGDGPFGCTYCEAISEAEGLLALAEQHPRATAGR